MKKILFLLLVITSIGAKAQSVPSNLYRWDTSIVINLSDDTLSTLILKRKAIFQTMTYNTKCNVKSLSIVWQVNYYVDSLGSYGAPVKLQGFAPYDVEFIASNTTYVDASTGAIQYYDSTYSSNGGYNPSLTLMTQYEWFTKLASSQSVVVNSMIAEFGEQGFLTRGY